MKQKIKNLIRNAATRAYEKGDLPSKALPEIEVEVPKIESHGDFSTNLAMVMASVQKMPSRKIAESILKHLTDPDNILAKTEIAGPGFINFFINIWSWYPVLDKIHQEDIRYGASDVGNGEKIQVEFVSSNPTGPLHVGHGRGAAVGDSVANILRFCGYDVQREYYINDSGRQIDTLGRSVFLRYKELLGRKIRFSEDYYQGDYITDFAKNIIDRKGKTLLDQDEETSISYCAQFAAVRIIAQIRQDLTNFGIEFDNWFSEQSLYDFGKVDAVIDDFRDNGYISRVTGAIEASGFNRNRFKVILVQLVNPLRGGEPVAMSTRAGEFVTLSDVIKEVGKDAARFIFLTRHYDSPLDFDLELAKKKTNDNPVFYVQYVHARISSIARKARERGLDDITYEQKAMAMLKEPEEVNLLKTMALYPEVLRNSAKFMEPHRITFYLMDLAACFHAYYNKHRVLSDEPLLSRGRLYMVLAVQKVIRNGLTLLGVSAPERM